MKSYVGIFSAILMLLAGCNRANIYKRHMEHQRDVIASIRLVLHEMSEHSKTWTNANINVAADATNVVQKCLLQGSFFIWTNQFDWISETTNFPEHILVIAEEKLDGERLKPQFRVGFSSNNKYKLFEGDGIWITCPTNLFKRGDAAQENNRHGKGTESRFRIDFSFDEKIKLQIKNGVPDGYVSVRKK